MERRMMVRFPSIDEYPAHGEDVVAPNPTVASTSSGDGAGSAPQRGPGRIKMALRHIHVEPAMFLLSLSYGLSGPTKQALIYRKVCLSLYNESICDNLYNSTFDPYLEETQKATSEFDFYANLSFNVPALLAIALFGSWSDTFSRKIPLLFAPIGSILNTTIVLFSALFIESSVWWLLLGQMLDGLTGGFACFLMAAFSYCAQKSSEQSRTKRISLVYACQTLGFCLATFTSGIFLDHTSFEAVLLTNIIILMTMLVYIIFCVKDVTPRNDEETSNNNTEAYLRFDDHFQKEEPRWRLSDVTCCNKMARLFSFSHMKKALIVTFKQRSGKTRQYILVLVAIAFLIMVTHAISINYLYYRHPPLELTQTEYGIFVGYMALVGVTGQGLVLPLLRGTTSQQDATANDASRTTAVDDKLELEDSSNHRRVDRSKSKPEGEVASCSGTGQRDLGATAVGINTDKRNLVGTPVRNLNPTDERETPVLGVTVVEEPPPRKRCHGPLGLLQGSDEALLIMSLISDMLGRLWTGFCVKKWMLYLTPWIGYMKPFDFTCIRSVMSRHVNQDEYGKIYAVVAWLETFAALGASYIYGKLLYPATVDTNPSISYYVSAVLMLLPLALSIWLYIAVKYQRSQESQTRMETAINQANAAIEHMDLAEQ